MPAIVDTQEEAARLAVSPLLVRRPLEAFLDAHGLGSGELAAQPVGEGHSNVTYLIRRTGVECILRRPPRPPLAPSAHDVLREARLLQALEPAAVRTPRVLLTCADTSVIGAPFYVMEKVEGDVVTRVIPDPLDVPRERTRMAHELVDALVEIHAVDWRACALDGYGHPDGYLERQVQRFSGLWWRNRTREVPEVDETTRWLGEHLPASGGATIVHGDYRLGNVMFARGAPARLVAVFDWELATIGDPLADVGYLTATYPESGEETSPLLSLGAVTTRDGFPTRAQLIARYEDASGRRAPDMRWYQTLALWKSAVFLEGSYRRLLAGTTDDPFFRLLAEGVPEIARRAWATARAG